MEEFDSSEKKFYYNLQFLIHPNSVLTIHKMFEFIKYINTHNINELIFVEGNYLNIFYEYFYENGNENICNFDELILFYNDAIKNNDNTTLLTLRILHRKAVEFLKIPELNSRLVTYSKNKESESEYKSYISLLQSISQYMSNFPNSNPSVINILKETLKKLSEEVIIPVNQTNK